MIFNTSISDYEEKIKNEYTIIRYFNKDRISFEYISKKIKEIRENPYHFKSLRAPLQNYMRVHIGNFVLIYYINENKILVIIEI